MISFSNDIASYVENFRIIRFGKAKTFNFCFQYISLIRRGYRGYGKFQEEKNDVIGSNKNNYLIVKFAWMFITRKP